MEASAGVGKDWLNGCTQREEHAQAGFLRTRQPLYPRARRLADTGFKMHYDGSSEGTMSKRELIVRELDRIPDQDLDKLLGFLRSLREAHLEAAVPTLAAESALAKDWLAPEEDAAWAGL
jgi:hypothetical protein